MVCSQSIDSTQNKKHQITWADSTSLHETPLFQLIDSLIQMPDLLEEGSSLVTRLGYTSNVMASNLGFGLNQFGLSPGLTYYHKTGLYADATTYWSQLYSPSLYLTVGSLGYLKSIKKWTFNVEYSRYFYSLTDSAYNSPYTNTVSMSNFLNVKPFMFRLDYSLYFGGKTANRITPTVMLNFEKKKWLGMDRLFFYPSFSVQMGNESWLTQHYKFYSTQPADILYRIKHNQPLYYLQNINNSAFGVLNYVVSLPLSVSIKNYSFQLNYSYYFPQALPHEPVGLNNSGFVSMNLIRYLNFKSRSSSIDFYHFPK